MEQLNKVELRGNVGNIRIQDVGDNRVARISLATNYVYKSKDGSAVVETSWHNVSVWNGKGMPDFEKITKGSCLYVSGRIRNTKYTSSDGVERQSSEVLANRIEICNHESVEAGN